MLSVDELREGFNLAADTDTSVDAGTLVACMCTAVRSLVEALEQDLPTPVLELEVLPESERRQVLGSFNATLVQYPSRRLVHELFEDQVKVTPDAVAVEH